MSSKKKPNMDILANELKGASKFFQRPSVLQTAPMTATTSSSDAAKTPNTTPTISGEHAHARTPERPNTRTGERPEDRPKQRRIERKSYNVYVDQHSALQRLEAKRSLSGNPIFLSQMVREAIDEWLAKHSEK